MQQECNDNCLKCCECKQEMIETCIQWHAISSLQVMSQCDGVECTLAKCILHDITKHGFDHNDVINKIEVHLKTRSHAFPAFRFVVKNTVEDAPVYDVESRIAEDMVAELTVYASVNVVQLFMQMLQLL